MDNTITRFHCSPDTNIKILKITKNKNNDYNFRKELPIISKSSANSKMVIFKITNEKCFCNSFLNLAMVLRPLMFLYS